jgi:hypothetical protein
VLRCRSCSHAYSSVAAQTVLLDSWFAMIDHRSVQTAVGCGCSWLHTLHVQWDGLGVGPA